MTIELEGIELFGFHGVLETERQHGQRFLVDLELALSEETAAAAAASDRIEDAVDYRDVVGAVRDVSDAHAYNLLEAFASAVAATLLERFSLTAIKVRVRKPDVVLATPVQHAAVVVEQIASGALRGA